MSDSFPVFNATIFQGGLSLLTWLYLHSKDAGSASCPQHPKATLAQYRQRGRSTFPQGRTRLWVRTEWTFFLQTCPADTFSPCGQHPSPSLPGEEESWRSLRLLPVLFDPNSSQSQLSQTVVNSLRCPQVHLFLPWPLLQP